MIVLRHVELPYALCFSFLLDVDSGGSFFVC